jgi:flavin reductase (DIM6/NTAB) family NADH-FMN oxidoreductase RutF
MLPLPLRNVMTISWLTATSNHGEFMASMNAQRCTARLVCAPGHKFVLAVPVAGMEDLVKAIGGCSGDDDQHGLGATVADLTQAAAAPTASPSRPTKLERLGLHTCRPGGGTVGAPGSDDERWDLFAIDGCVAHMVCVVSHVLPASTDSPVVAGHNVLFCRIERAYVHKGYWAGANFLPTSRQFPPYLTFLGQGNFAHVVSPPSK